MESESAFESLRFVSLGENSVEAWVEITKLVSDGVGIDQNLEVPGHQGVDQERGDVPASQFHEHVAEGLLPELMVDNNHPGC